jgi:hypothetical protein
MNQYFNLKNLTNFHDADSYKSENIPLSFAHSHQSIFFSK